MGLMKSPSLLTFLVAVALATFALLTKFGLVLPAFGIASFWMLFAAFVLLVLGAITRGM